MKKALAISIIAGIIILILLSVIKQTGIVVGIIIILSSVIAALSLAWAVGVLVDIKETKREKKQKITFATRSEMTIEPINPPVVPYQKCPVCDGVGQVPYDSFDGQIYTACSTTCSVCGGSKIIPMHALPIDGPIGIIHRPDTNTSIHT